MKKLFQYIRYVSIFFLLGILTGCSLPFVGTNKNTNIDNGQESVTDDRFKESFEDPTKIIERALNILTYKNNDFNIELQYPTIYKIVRTEKALSGNKTASVLNFYDIVKLGDIKNVSETQPDFWISLYDNDKMYLLDDLVANVDFGRPKENIQETAKTFITGFEGREIIYSGLAPKITTIIFLANNKIYEISTFGTFSDMVRTIIGSIIIGDGAPKKEIKNIEYNSEKNELSVKYPENWSLIDLGGEMRLFHDAAIQNPEESFQMIVKKYETTGLDALYKEFLISRLDNNKENINIDKDVTGLSKSVKKYTVKNVKNSVWKTIPYNIYIFNIGGDGIIAECLIPLAGTCEKVIDNLSVYDLTPSGLWVTYSDSAENISFEYPREWGSIVKTKTDGTLSGYKVTYSFENTNVMIGGATDNFKNKPEDKYTETFYDFSYFSPADKDSYNLVYPQSKAKVKADKLSALFKSRENIFFVFTQGIKKEHTNKDLAGFVNLFNPEGLKGLVVQYKNYQDVEGVTRQIELLTRSMKKIK